jgi:hypothetical protein
MGISAPGFLASILSSWQLAQLHVSNPVCCHDAYCTSNSLTPILSSTSNAFVTRGLHEAVREALGRSWNRAFITNVLQTRGSAFGFFIRGMSLRGGLCWNQWNGTWKIGLKTRPPPPCLRFGSGGVRVRLTFVDVGALGVGVWVDGNEDGESQRSGPTCLQYPHFVCSKQEGPDYAYLPSLS